ncbi:MAG TPA: proton-conducting transporter membrane subunit [Kiritimatiellia bacterium]|nr:proton-conducting transporter membrane subunit [Kiritimatiellia bacterium]HMO99267.1 proton-conducting transporter membrane subunit [Kiritimatiellia bacterium]HMP97698.1 proton-conducting transporter membrane subunit [Kiritimatiellia bacterium]
MTSLDAWIPLLVLLTSFVTGVIILALGEHRVAARTALNLIGAVAKMGLVAMMLWGVFHGHEYQTRIPFLPGFDLVLRADGMTVLFSTLSAGLWLLTTIYAIGYLENSPFRRRFFGYFSFCVTATMGVSLAGNLVTFFLFYEMLTLTTYPLVVHRGNEKSIKAGTLYLAYTLGGSALFLVGMVWLYSIAGAFDFTETGVLSALPSSTHGSLVIIFFLFMLGAGVKAALFPLHAWLPSAMVAPAPVSALLHAVAVVKAGAFGMVRIVYDVFGIEFAETLQVLTPFMIMASFTILYGSARALVQDDFKKRLAFSTVSQVSYILLGITLFGPLGTVGGLVHLVHQGVMKITMFFAAGNIAETLHLHKISELKGVGRRMPLTMGAFSIAALGMIGVPPLAGFISKWYLGLGAVESGNNWVLLVLAASSLLNAAYFLPILRVAWFERPDRVWEERHARGWLEASWWLVIPPVVTALLTVLVGLFAGSDYSPLQWALLITGREY